MEKIELVFKSYYLIDVFLTYQKLQVTIDSMDSNCSYEEAKGTSDITHIIAELSSLNIKGAPPEEFLKNPEKNNEDANTSIETEKEYQNLLLFSEFYDFDKKYVHNWAKEKYSRMKKLKMHKYILEMLENVCFSNWCSWYMAYFKHEVTKEKMQENLILYSLLGFHRKVSLEKFFDKAKSIYNEYINVEKT